MLILRVCINLFLPASVPVSPSSPGYASNDLYSVLEFDTDVSRKQIPKDAPNHHNNPQVLRPNRAFSNFLGTRRIRSDRNAKGFPLPFS